MVIKIVFSLLIASFTLSSSASRLYGLHEQKQYSKIVKEFFNREFINKMQSKKDYAILSYALRKEKRFRDDSKLIARYLNKFHSEEHKKISLLIKQKKSINADEFSQPLKIYYWHLYNDLAMVLLSYKKKSPRIEQDKKYFEQMRIILTELEFRDILVEDLYSKVIQHLQDLENKIYRLTKSFYVQYLSWQNSSELYRQSSGKTTDLVLTNTGTCIGGDIGIQNAFYEYSLDGCFIYGSGKVSSFGAPNITYNQTIPAYAFKLAPQLYRVVSSTNSKIGIAFPIMYTIQNLSKPGDPDYQLVKKSDISFLLTINSKWQFDKWYVKTEFGQFIKKEDSYWSIGIGRNF